MFSSRINNRFNLFKAISCNLFIISIEYKKPLDQIDQYLDEHKKFLEKCYQQKTFIASGRKVPRTGGIIIASAKEKTVLEALLEEDPFYKYQLASYQITEFLPTMYADDFSKIVEHDQAVTSNYPK